LRIFLRRRRLLALRAHLFAARGAKLLLRLLKLSVGLFTLGHGWLV
jgi:hypothetical protein